MSQRSTFLSPFGNNAPAALVLRENWLNPWKLILSFVYQHVKLTDYFHLTALSQYKIPLAERL